LLPEIIPEDFIYHHIAEVLSKMTKNVGCWWLTPIILPTQEAEIRRTVVQSQPGQIVHKTYLENSQQEKG
jgi:hypothetical protein